MASPVDVARQTFGTGASVSGQTIDLPPSIAAGDLLIALFIWFASAERAITGFTTIAYQGSFSGSTAAMIVAYRVADGSEGATVATNYTGGGKCCSVVWRITGADTTVAPSLSTFATATGSTSVDPTTLSPAGGSKDYLWLFAAGCARQPTMPPSGSPTNYSNPTGVLTGGSGSAANKQAAFGASRQRTAATEDPPAWTIDTATEWGAWTIGIAPAATGQYTDTATITVDLQASSVELAETVDSATTLVALQVSATEVHEIPDAATVLVDLQASGTELLAKDYTDSVTVLVDLQASGTDIYTPAPTAVVTFVQKPIIVGGTTYQDRSRW